jgi:hypothetical protein
MRLDPEKTIEEEILDVQPDFNRTLLGISAGS